jgi:hypothetical protein
VELQNCIHVIIELEFGGSLFHELIKSPALMSGSGANLSREFRIPENIISYLKSKFKTYVDSMPSSVLSNCSTGKFRNAA